MHKAAGGLIRATIEVKDDWLAYVSLSGDFFCYPHDAIGELEAVLEGTPLDRVGDVLDGFYAQRDIETPGVVIDDWIKVLNA
jgi:hypothetical protein